MDGGLTDRLLDGRGDGSGAEDGGPGPARGRGGGRDAGADHRPQPGKYANPLLSVCPFILVNEMCERLAYNGLSTNLVVYLTRVMGESPAAAAVQTCLLEGTCYLTPLAGAYLADGAWGRYKTILAFSTIYWLGLVGIWASTVIPGASPSPGASASPLQNAAFFIPLYVVALGTGGIKPNVSAFGADQFDPESVESAAAKRSFFNFFYFFVNLGSMVAVTGVVYVQDSVSWSAGFAIPAAAMGAAIAVFVAGGPRYRHVPPAGSPLSRVVAVVRAAAANARAQRRAARARGHGGRDPPGGVGGSVRGGAARGAALSPLLGAGTPTRRFEGPVNLPPGSGAATPVPVRRVSSFQWLSFAEAPDVEEEGGGGATTATPTTAPPSPSPLARFTRSQVEEVRCVLRMLPVFWTTAFYWALYAQMGSFFVVQGQGMDRRFAWPRRDGGSGGGRGGGPGRGRLSLSFDVPAASLALFNTAAILVFVPLYDRVLVPGLARAGRRLSLLQRIGWGLAVSVLAMAAAAVVEARRLALVRAGDTIPGTRGDVAAMSVLWQVPQYVLVGLSEVFTSIGQLEFFYDQAPDVMRSCSMALQLLSVAVGSYASGGVVAAVSAGTAAAGWNGGAGWLPADLNAGRLDAFFWAFAGLAALNTAWFIAVASRYVYKDVPHHRRAGAAPAAAAVPATPPLTPGRPRRGPGAPSPRVIAIRGPPRGRRGLGTPGSGEEAPYDPYGRSVTFVPESPALPAPFR